jgi:hypothetical protein
VLGTLRFRARRCYGALRQASRDRAFAGDFDGSFVVSLSE